jgi:hypothetical protein
MMYNTWDYWDFGLCPLSDILKNTEFRNWTSLQNVVFFGIPDDEQSTKPQESQ